MNYEKFLSKAVCAMKPSGIRKYFDLAASMPDCISLGVGEPNFVTPRAGIDAAIKSMEDGITRYTSNNGWMPLRKNICKYLNLRYGLEYDPENEVIVTVGVSEAIMDVMQTIINPGDEILIAEPCFVSYAPSVIMAGGVPKVLNCRAEDNFIITPEELEKGITEKTKALFMCYPNNPTGAVMTKDELEAIAPIIIKHDILCLSDEVYSELTYGGLTHVSIASLPGMRERTFVFNGFSKGFAMTGWRIGYVCAPKEMMKQTMKVHQFAIMCAPTAGQYAANALLEDAFATDFAEVRKMVEEYDRKRKYLYKALLDMGLECFEPRGAFYMFPSVKSTGISGDEFSERLLMEKRVCIPAGIAFGQSGYDHIRISYAYAMDQIEKGAERMAEMVKELNANKK